jgi:hypothetical protein
MHVLEERDLSLLYAYVCTQQIHFAYVHEDKRRDGKSLSVGKRN